MVQPLDVDILEDVVEYVMLHLANDKRHGWDGLTNELFKKYVTKLKGPFYGGRIAWTKVAIREAIHFSNSC